MAHAKSGRNGRDNFYFVVLLALFAVQSKATEGNSPTVSWTWDPIIAVTGIGVGALSAKYLADMPATDLNSLNKNGIPAYDRWAIRFYSPVTSLASDVSVAMNQYVRSLQVHPRPFVFNPDAPLSDRLKGEASGSFYSGHATTAFLSAVYLSYTYPIQHPDFEGKNGFGPVPWQPRLPWDRFLVLSFRGCTFTSRRNGSEQKE